MHLIEGRNLKVYFDSDAGKVHAVDNVNFHIDEGENLVFIGETGSGKTVLGMTIMRLLPSNVYYEGELFYKDKNLIKASEKEMEALRGKELAIIMQNPLTALNPCMSIRAHLVQVLQKHKGMDKKSAAEKAAEILMETGIPEDQIDYYAHQLSGGLRQRALIALGLACDSEILIADEPTKGLDVTVQLQVVKLLRKISENTNKSMFIITHDLGVAAALADRIAIMYCGRILESGTVPEIFETPFHPYTKGLIAAHPSRGLNPIDGYSASLVNLPKGCVFCPRCEYATEKCHEEEPGEIALSDTHKVRCYLAGSK